MRNVQWFVVGALAACGDDTAAVPDAPPADAELPIDAPEPVRSVVAEVPVAPPRDIDLLFVVDDSPSMLDKQKNLVANFPAFVNVLGSLPGGLPNLHLGVITSDMGVTTSTGQMGSPVVSCTGSGKGGNLRIGTAPVDGAYLVDVADGAGRDTNYTGTLADAFTAMASVGANGCGFEQTLGAMRAALDNNPANAGFLRPDALLGVVFVTDEDDCTISDPTIFGPESLALGPRQSFRCTRFGVTCAQGGATSDAMNEVGAKSQCSDNTASTLIDPVMPYREFLLGVKGGDASQVIVAGIMGDSEPVAVELRTIPGSPTIAPALAHSCTYQGEPTAENPSGTEVADPGTRLQTFFSVFPGRSTITTICQRDLSDSLQQIGQLVTSSLGSGCIGEAIADADAETPGFQPDCIVEDVVGTTATAIAACGPTPTGTCWSLVDAPELCTYAPNLQLVITRDVPGDPAAITRMRCVVE